MKEIYLAALTTSDADDAARGARGSCAAHSSDVIFLRPREGIMLSMAEPSTLKLVFYHACSSCLSFDSVMVDLTRPWLGFGRLDKISQFVQLLCIKCLLLLLPTFRFYQHDDTVYYERTSSQSVTVSNNHAKSVLCWNQKIVRGSFVLPAPACELQHTARPTTASQTTITIHPSL
jgi:hypothetical protein